LNPEVRETNAIRAELEAFAASILENKPVVVSEVDGLMAMDVAHQILHKIQSNILPAATS
jgi:predicted dehydrogenase